LGLGTATLDKYVESARHPADRARTADAQEYKTRTQLLNVEAAEAEAEAAAVAEEAGETREEQGTQQADEKTIEKEDHLPIARVKRIIKCVFSPLSTPLCVLSYVCICRRLLPSVFTDRAG
jgi:hypothetical protein